MTARCARPPGREDRGSRAAGRVPRARGDARPRSALTSTLVKTPEHLAGVDAIVLPGGESTTIDKLLDSSGLRAPLRDALRDGLPAFATCAGLIVLASRGRRRPPRPAAARRARRHGAPQRLRPPARVVRGRRSPSRDLAGGPFPGVFIRAPVVERVGPGVEVLAEHDGVPVLGRQGARLVRFVSSRALGRSSPARALRARGELMSGHSKWHSIKHKKGAADAKRGKLFAVLIRQIEVAARSGGGDPASNATLRTMVQKARDNSLPIDTIQRAIKRGTGEEEGVIYEPVTYEGYAAERRRGDRAGAHRQPQPHVGRDQEHLQPQRRFVRRAGRGVVAVRAQGRSSRSTRRPTRTSSCSRRPTPAPRTSRTSATRGRSRRRPPSCTRCAPRSRRRASR